MKRVMLKMILLLEMIPKETTLIKVIKRTESIRVFAVLILHEISTEGYQEKDAYYSSQQRVQV